jgi:predicted RNA-binding Zn-ribbon protein involved in translation (DUF1610 family)
MTTYDTRKQERDDLLRCLNCFKRMKVPTRAELYTCPECGIKYEIAWRGGQAKILGVADYSAIEGGQDAVK